MGDRATIIVESKDFVNPISLYGHWSGEDNVKAVENVLARTSRVGDPSYLTAQLFYEFAIQLGKYDGELGFGIGTWYNPTDCLDDNPYILINADNGTYSIEQREREETYA